MTDKGKIIKAKSSKPDKCCKDCSDSLGDSNVIAVKIKMNAAGMYYLRASSIGNGYSVKFIKD